MRIEEEVFARHRIVPEKLIAYGFTDENGRLTYARALPDDGMKIIVEYDGAIKAGSSTCRSMMSTRPSGWRARRVTALRSGRSTSNC